LAENGSGNTSKENKFYEISQINEKLLISSLSLLQLSDYLFYQDEPVLIIFPDFKEIHQRVLREQVSISSTLYVQIFCTKVASAAFF